MNCKEIRRFVEVIELELVCLVHFSHASVTLELSLILPWIETTIRVFV
jgi:hypothetical protein